MSHPRAFSLWKFLAAFLLLPCTALFSITTYQTQGAINTMTDLQQAFEALLELLTNIVYLPIAVGFVVATTAALKRFIPESAIRPQTLAVVLNTIIWVVFIIARERFGMSEEVFASFLEGMTTVLNGLLAIIGTAAVSHQAYQTLHRNNVPFFGQPQPPSKTVAEG